MPVDPARPDAWPGRELDARSLRGLAHPLRLEILDVLTLEGPATATGLADRLGVRSGSTSWHLSKLAEHGLVEEALELGNRRDRWWRAAQATWSIDSSEFVDDAELADVSDVLLGAVIGQQMMRANQFVQQDWAAEWRRSWILSTQHSLRLTPDRLAALRAELSAVIERYRTSPSTVQGAEHVVVQMQGFPYPQQPPR